MTNKTQKQLDKMSEYELKKTMRDIYRKVALSTVIKTDKKDRRY